MADPNSTEAKIARLTEVAKNTGLDSFRVRIEGTAPGGIYPSKIATLDDATVDHIANSELWITKFLGAGQYKMHAAHVTAKNNSLETFPVEIGGVRRAAPDTSVVDDPHWAGPRTLIFPEKPAQAPPAQFMGVGAGGGQTPRNVNDLGNPPAPAVPVTAAADPTVAATLARLNAREEEMRRREADLAEQRHRMERESDRRDAEARDAKLRAEISMLAAQKPVEKGPDPIFAVLVEMQKSQQAAADRTTQMIMEMQKQSREEQRAQQQQMLAMFDKLASKPEISPIMERLLTKNDEANAQAGKVVAQMAESAGAAVNMMVSAMHAIRELDAGPAEPPMLQMIKEGVKGFMAYSEATKAAEEAKAATAQAAAAARAERARRSNGTAQPAAPRPVQVVPPPPPTVVQGPAPAVAPTLDGVEEDGQTEGDASAPGEMTAFEQIVQGIMEKQDQTQIAQFFLDNLDEPSINAAMVAAGGNPLVAFQEPLKDWLMEDESNRDYVIALLQTVKKLGEGTKFREATPEEIERANKRLAQSLE